ncbi:aldo/keto reductase [Flavilitoribacter nigricans]|uniref:Protein tas n=1 Tax=Flavilitoribacter nigricans (strain ATCC 23147 / DSM 23189 / NBRC 102662 / NCIMB 1420 / SS-2) TaxID=1122177 RepID=A0A2D0N8S7_FLAN2|nr:aldo/keto reductase [Flavilitoribacter nigricans]PHN04798.1 aldo/keto reductase [Flavilitoribacter nigricans DSM 23189 = NBRC 102662]
MEFRQLGNTDLQVSLICLGTMTFGEQNTEAEGHQQLDYALERGINFIDTAELYSVPGRQETQGSTERIVGTWLKDRSDRDKIILATKIVGPSPGLLYIRNPLDFKPASIRTAIEGSLRRLQTDYVDLYQLHWPERKNNRFSVRDFPADPNDPWEDNFLQVLESMQKLVDEGKIRHFGISNETPWGAMRLLNLAEQHGLPRCVSIQNPYSLLNRTFEIGLSEIAIRENMGLLAYSPMAFGLLSGKYHRGEDQPDNRINQFQQMARYSRPTAHEATARYLKIAEAHGLSLAQMSLAFVNSRPFTTSNIIGATNMEQLKENIDSYELELSEEVLKAINEVHDSIPNPAP